MSIVYYIILFVFGLIFGSFLNVVAWRYKPGKSVFRLNPLKGRSHCPYCDKKLRWIELIPLASFFIQGGKCRECGHKLSWQYPIVELLSGVIFAGVPYYLIKFYSIESISHNVNMLYALIVLWILVFTVWLLISAIDRRHYLVPNELNITLG